MNLHRILSRLVSLFAIATTCGCVTGAKFSGPRPAPENTALLYVFRPSNPPLALKPAIVVNGIKAADLTNKGYFDLELRPGAYIIKADWSWASGVPDSEIMLHAESGQTYYVLIDSSMHTSGYVAGGVTVVPVLKFAGGIRLVDSSAAATIIASCGEVKKIPGVEGLIHPK